MSIKLSKRTEREVYNKFTSGDYPKMRTGFFTKNGGPRKGTIWMYPHARDGIGWQVTRVTKDRIHFANQNWRKRKMSGSRRVFLRDVEAGRMVLVGVRPDYRFAVTSY